MGRRAKPVSVHLLNGNPSKLPNLKPDTAPLAAGEHQTHDNSVAELPVPPPRKGLNAAARRHWQRLAPTLVFRGVLRDTDLDSFETLCRLEAEFAELSRLISSPKKAYYKKEGVIRRHPAVADRHRIAKDLRDYRDRFGLSPQARARVPMGVAPNQPTLPGLAPPNPQPKPDEHVAPPATGNGDPLDAFINERPSLPN